MTAKQAFEITFKSSEDAFELYNRCLDNIIKSANKGEFKTRVKLNDFDSDTIEVIKKYLEMDGFKVMISYKKIVDSFFIQWI